MHPSLLTLPALLGASLQEPGPPVVRAERTTASIQVDGHLLEEAWATAGRIDQLTQVEPFQGQPAQARTEVLLLFDADHLYLGFRCFDPEPSRIVATQSRRDGELRSDDRVSWILDTFHDQRRAYLFHLTAAGGRRDILIDSGGLRRNPQWDGLWRARTQIGADGWTAEVAIPFATLAFDPAGTWGFNVERFRANGLTLDRWASPSRSRPMAWVPSAGILTGLSDMEQGLGLELKPAFKAALRHDHASNDRDLLGTPSGDLTWRILPSLTGSVTLNTDFAETEIDDLQVNLTRFPLFFPEKRDFFLEDASLFQFGPVLSPAQIPDFLPYFSRTIGLVSGQEVPLEGGARLAGAIGPLEMGVLAVRTEPATFGAPPTSLAVPDGELLVLRPALALSKALQVGGLLTAGDPTSDAAAQTAGLDLRWTKNNVLCGAFGLNLYAMRTVDGGTDRRDVAYGLQTRLQTDNWIVQYDASAVGDAFRPALGFVRRRGFHKHRLDLDYMPRPESGAVRSYAFGVEPIVYTDLSNDVESYLVDFQVFGLQLHNGDALSLSVIPEGDRPATPFSPAPGSVIPAGEHDWVQGQLSLSSSTVRPLSAAVTLRGGSWYDGGDLAQVLASAEWWPSMHLRLGAVYQQSHAELPGGDFTLRLEQLRLDWVFTPELSWQNLVQSDNLSRTLGWQGRLRWILEDNRELFLVAGSGWLDTERALIPTRTDLSLKLVFALRF